MANQIVVQNLILDPTSPYYYHPSENPGAVIVTIPLNGDNYHSWARVVTMALETKNKVQFIDGTLPRPPNHDPLFPCWNRCNNLVVSWLNHSIHQTILPSILWMKNALEIWNDLKERYYQGDVFRILELIREIYSIKQGTLSI
ncbi:PREDICTED: uncharacterized protein LOC109337423 [Lupinus angustifolius]|uniref:uncharacterized protein LOC109337423 n=1 Tax=Lupinus angustifolius TaxID=3871 RepID=UPI00092F827C|nr:PREDICTED: uncharacterized protein LOC109337423 [Lupinus angustifolius]